MCCTTDLFICHSADGVLDAVARLLARESEQAPEEINHPCSNTEDISTEIPSDNPDQNIAILRDFSRATGYVEIAMLNTLRAIECIAYASSSVEVLDKLPAWGYVLPLLSSSPPHIAQVAAKVLPKYCLRNTGVAMKVASLRPAKSIFVTLELAQLSLWNRDIQTHRASMILLEELAPSPEFLDTVKKPTPFSLLCTIFVNLDLRCHKDAVAAACICLKTGVTNCDECFTFAEEIAPKISKKLLEFWKLQDVSHVTEGHQAEGLLKFLLTHGQAFEQAITGLCSNEQLNEFCGELSTSDCGEQERQTERFAFSPFGMSPSVVDDRSPDVNAARMDLQRIFTTLAHWLALLQHLQIFVLEQGSCPSSLLNTSKKLTSMP